MKLRIIFSTLLFIFGIIGVSDAEVTKDINGAISDLKSSALKLGEPKVILEDLYFGDTKINDNFDIVDEIAKKYKCTATFFVKSETGFKRVSTNVIKEGKRAVGTLLDPNGPAIVKIKEGQSFYGEVDILGKLFDTGYEPIINNKGEILGVYYVGYPIIKK